MNTDTPTDDRPSQAEALAEQLRGDNATGAVEIVKVFAAGGSEGSNLLVEQVPIG